MDDEQAINCLLKDNTSLSDQTTVTVSLGFTKTSVADIICQKNFLMQIILLTDVLVQRGDWDGRTIPTVGMVRPTELFFPLTTLIGI